MDLKYLVTATRPRVYLLWAVLVPIGFVATHFYQNHNINYLWVTIAIIGLGYMYKVMPLRVGQLRKIFLAWLVPITGGIIISGAVFYIHGSFAGNLIGHLGALWLAVMAVGYFLNGLVDAPSTWYWFAAILNAVAAVAVYAVHALVASQYLIAAVVSAMSMLLLWLLRSEV